LPDFIPTSFVVPTGLITSASVAMDFLNAGALTDMDADLPSVMIQNSLIGWFGSLIADVKHFAPHIFLTHRLKGLDERLDIDNSLRCFETLSAKDDTLSFGIFYDEWAWFSLKEKIEALETKIPGLGETAISYMDGVLAQIGYPITPSRCLELASYHYWMGSDDEKDYLEEWGLNAEEEEEVEIFRRAEFDANFPVLSYNPSKKLDKEALQNLMSHPDREVAELASFLLTFDEGEGYSRPAYPSECGDDHLPVTSPLVCVCWKEADATMRIADDAINAEMEYGGTTLHAFWLFPKNAEGIIAAKRQIGRYVDFLKWAENLFSFIGTELE